jgi:hypothetical protein
LFVDVRISRSVRATGLSRRCIRGSDRTQAIPLGSRLGNKAVANPQGSRIQINDPAAAGDLLDLALERLRAPAQIFFCACECRRCLRNAQLSPRDRD